jgi:ankyrin repeat protein
MYAAGRRFPGTTDTVKLLLDMGANPAAKDKAGKTALSEAQQRGSPEVVELLQKAGTPR